VGVYINPPSGTKEDWLDANAEPDHSMFPLWKDVPEGYLPVCLVFNAAFTAAGVAYNEGELKAFSDPTDWRPKFWYRVRKELLTADVIGDVYVKWLKEMGVLT